MAGASDLTLHDAKSIGVNRPHSPDKAGHAKNNGAGGGTRTRTELSLLRISSRSIIAKNSLLCWLYSHHLQTFADQSVRLSARCDRREEREILSKAAAWFATETGSVPSRRSNSMYFATVAWLTSMPSLRSSPWIRV